MDPPVTCVIMVGLYWPWLVVLLSVQILLLGPGEAGKSTVLKQLKCIYKGGIPLAEQRVRLHHRSICDSTPEYDIAAAAFTLVGVLVPSPCDGVFVEQP